MRWEINGREDLQAVCDAAPRGTTIVLAPATYRQKLIVRTPGLHLVGAGADRTRIVFSDAANQKDAVGRPVGTFRSFTVAITAPDVTLTALTVENDAGDPKTNGQQVALSVYGERFAAERCTLRSTQDTLFLGPLPPDLIRRYRDVLPPALRRDVCLSSRFSRCRIEGTVDFVFGGGDALFSDCELRSVSDGRRVGYVCAPSHDAAQTEGFRFDRCAFTRSDDVPTGSVYLARPWRDAGLAFFDHCTYGPHIHPLGFDPWGTTDRAQTARFYETPPLPSRVPWCNPTDR